MAVTEKWILVSEGQLYDADSSTSVHVIVDEGAPSGAADPQASANKGTLYFRTDQTDDLSPLYVKVDADSADDDWVQVMVETSDDAYTFNGDVTLGTSTGLQLRDSGQKLYSPSDGVGFWALTGTDVIRLGDQSNSNYVQIGQDGDLTFTGTQSVPAKLHLPLDSQHGTATSEAFNGAPSINLDADGETWYLSFPAPWWWDAASDLTLVFMVANEAAEDDGDDVSITCQVRGYADGETTSDAGQTVTASLNLTGGDEAINVVNRVTGTIDYDEGTYPIAAGDTVVVKCTINLTGAGEADGPLHVLAQWIEPG